MMLTIPSPEEVFTDELAKPGNWIVASLTTNADWPVKRQTTTYLGHEIWVIPTMRGFYPAIATIVSDLSKRSETQRAIMRFLSALMWIEGRGAVVEYMTGGNLPRPMGRSETTGYAVRDEFDLTFVPEITGESASLAVALMREARIINHPAYAFLSFYRAFEAAVAPRQRNKWISSFLLALEDNGAKIALENLLKSGKSHADIPQYLYESCRHAIAHARQSPVVHPDDLDDNKRLYQVNPLMEAIAETATERELGVKTRHTVWREHLYELDGWKRKLGPEFIARVMRGPTADPIELDVPKIHVRLNGRAPYVPFEGMDPVEGELLESKLLLTYASKSRFFM